MQVKPHCKDDRAALTERISESPSFVRAPKLRELFLHICRTSLAGRDHFLVEQKIGEQVFGRDPGYNAGEDSIVRAQVRLLRRKLDAWYAEEGRTESLRVSIPRGGYVPVWTENPLPAAAETHVVPEPVRAPLVEPKSTPVPPADRRTSRAWGLLLLGFACCMAAFLGGWSLSRLMAPPAATAQAFKDRAVLMKFFDNKLPVLVVVQDASLVLVNNALRTTTSLADFQSGQYRQRLADPAFNPDYRRLLQMIDSRQYTSLGDMGIVRSLLAAMPDAQERVQVVSARHLHHRQLKTSNAILVGGHGANPWIELFDPALSFRVVFDPESGFLVRNFDPRPGEQVVYRPEKDIGYGVLAAVPNADGNGSVMVMAGDRLESTEAASEFIFSTEKARTFATMLQKAAAPGRELRRFQAVVRTRRVQGTSTGSEIVALRVE